jgi:hypothetical protein
MESNIGSDQVKQLSELKNTLLGNDDLQRNNTVGTKLIEHANFHHDFVGIPRSDLARAFLQKDMEGDQNKIPIIAGVVKKDNNTIELTKTYLFKDFYNTEGAATEKIIIKRDSDSDVLISFYEDKFKKIGTYITPMGNYTSMAKFKQYRNAEEVLFNANLFNYHSIIEVGKLYRLLGKLPVKKQLEINKLYYYEYLKNLF